jgi:hypothetical protein
MHIVEKRQGCGEHRGGSLPCGDDRRGQLAA